MNKVPASFYMMGTLFAICGMIWGIYMSATHDHILSPAHGHLNLIGFVTMFIFGTYYALTPSAANSNLAKIHLGLAVLSVVTITPGIAFALTGQTEVLAKIGSLLTLLAMLLFGFIIFKHGVGQKQTS
ncbi:MAG: hypothetical protein JJ879_00565 [Sneathiella sp.]|nr:hypothetical protein [Sneathiella sp.]